MLPLHPCPFSAEVPALVLLSHAPPILTMESSYSNAKACKTIVIVSTLTTYALSNRSNQGLYIVFQMDWKCVHCPMTKDTFLFLQS